MTAVWLLVGLGLGAALVLAAVRGRLVRAGELARERDRLQRDLAEARAQRSSQEQMESAFKALSADVLAANSGQFLELARSNLGALQAEARGDLDKRKQAVAELVRPLGDSLRRMDDQLSRLDRERRQSHGALAQQLRQVAEGQERLRGETGNLVAALRQPQTRGRWGEIQLRRVVEMAGMLAHCDFTEQGTVMADGRALRPDLVVRLPGGKDVVVDAKAPLVAYLEAVEATDEEARRAAMARHAGHIREHMRKLAAKSYWAQFQSAPEFVVMFLPGEPFFSAALQEEPGLIEEGVAQHVLLATPTTLIALLRAVAYGWQQERVAEGAREVAAAGRELHGRLGTFAEHLAKVGRGLSTSVQAYNQAVGSFESRVLPGARRLADHGMDGGKEVPSLAPVETTPRPIHAPEPASTELPEADAA